MIRFVCYLSLIGLLWPALSRAQSGRLTLTNDRVRLVWQPSSAGYQLREVGVRRAGKWVNLGQPSGEHTLLYAVQKPKTTADTTFRSKTGEVFPGPLYKYQTTQWSEVTSPVALNTAGNADHFFPKTGKTTGANQLQFRHETAVATLVTDWSLDPKHPTDLLVTQTVTAKRAGYFSAATPTLSTVPEAAMSWATVPGYFQGNAMESNLALSLAYGHGVPARPVVFRERCASTLCPMVSTKTGLTLSVIPEPGLARDPWLSDKITQTDWNLGLSHMNRRAQLSPTLYYPVLGEPKSALQLGQTIRYSFRYSLTDGDWFAALNHAVYDVYQFDQSLAMRQSKQSLTSRVEQMHHYLTDPVTSLWNVEDYQGLKIGGQSYFGGVVGSNKDAMKNADYGAMWMLANATGDSLLTRNVLPYALNFKLTQQQDEPGFFQGAAVGQYYLAKSKKFVEEWGDVVEPMALTYYTMLDVGNILLFDSTNQQLRDRLRLGAERLLTWQKPDGSWAVAYNRQTETEAFRDIRDFRPTFYGLLVAYRLLKDEKYLTAARKGADWFIKNAVETGSFLGVCGDARYAPDFATGQSAQALLDLYDFTRDERYKRAAITCAKIYTASIYTHPIPTRQPKTVKGTPREDWEIAQSGLSFEHGGTFGSANRAGPIQLASHAGLFIRMHQLTGEPIFADMARAGAIGRDAFVDAETSVASYYWNAMDRGAGPYPHHAWWQIGWITDYLMAEAELRSGGQVRFPRGFITPKVGPHQSYGFAPGSIYGQPASLLIREGFVQPDNPNVDYILAQSPDKKTVYVVVLNSRAQPTTVTIQVNQTVLSNSIAGIRRLPSGRSVPTGTISLDLPEFGQDVLAIDLR